MLVWNGDCYYLLGHTDRHAVTPFRVDRIALPPHILEEDAVPQPEDFDITRVNTMFGMFIGEPQRVTLVCDNSMMDHIVDRFGEDVETFPVDGKTFQASVLVTASKPFFGWVFGFDGKGRGKLSTAKAAENALDFFGKGCYSMFSSYTIPRTIRLLQ